MKKYIKKIIAIFTVMTLVGSNIPCSFAKESSTQELSAKEKYEQYLSETSGNTSDTQIIVKVKEDLAGGDNEAGVFTAAAMERSQRQYSIVKTIDSANISILETDANNLDSVLNELNSYEDIAYAQPDYKVVTAENGVNKNLWAIQNFGQTVDRSTGQSGFDTNLTRAWEITKGAEEVVVAVIDTGIDIHHESLQGSIWTNSGEIAGNNNDDDLNGYVNDINGWDFVNDDSTVYDMDALDEHGTHMAGIIAGSGEISGAAPNVKIMPLKALNYASGYTSDILEAIEYAKNNGAKIINCSFASIEYNPALEDAIASNPDILFVCAAGNYGCSTNEIATFPACYGLDNIIAVSAANNRGELSAFSTYGDDIDVAAPGVGIYSTLPAGRYGYKDGTSCSAAYISGIAALILSNDKELSAEQLKEKIISSMSSALPVENSDEAVQAEGFVDALAAINYPLEKKADAFAYTTDTEEYNLFEKYPFEISLMQNYPQIVFDASEGFDRVELKIYEETDEKIEEFIVDEDISTALPFLLSALLPDTDYRFSVKITKGITKYEYIGTLKYNSTENNQTLNSHVESAQQYEVPDNIPVSETIYYTAEEKENTIQTMSAGIINEKENNNTIDLADLTFDDYDTYGYINPSSDIDYFKVKFNEKGVANFWLGNIPSGCDYELDLYDETGFRLASSHNSGDVQELIQFYPVDPNIYYYIKVSSYRGSSSTSPYLVRAKYYPLPDDYEKNDVPEDASALSKYKNTIYANINHPEDVDYYKISIPSKFLLTLDLVRPSSEYRFEIYKDPALTQSIIYTTGTTYTRELSSGTYYIKIYRITGYSGENYTLNMECNPIYTMEPGQAYFDKVKDSNNVYYQMEVSGNIGIQIDLSDYENADFDLFLYDANYVELAQSKTTNVAEQICESLTSGSYRIRVRRYSGTYENYLIETSVSTDENAAYLTSAAFPSSMNVNEVKTVKVLATNNGANAWQSSAGYKLGRLNDSASLTPNDLTLNSTERIPYKKSKTFIFNITAPEVDVSTSYTTGWRMKRNSLFFGDTLRKSITVEPNYDTLSVGTLKSVAGKPSGIKYAFTATSAGNYVFRTFKNITSCDTKLTIYDASMKRVAWNDDLYSGNLYSRLEVNLRAGIYYIEVTEFDEKPIYCHLSVEKYSFSDIQLNETEYIRNQYEGYYTFTVAQPGTYIITTEFYWEYCDTYLVLYNS